MKKDTNHFTKEDLDFISHELRNSLTVVQGNLGLIEFISKKTKLNPEILNFLKISNNELKKIGKMLLKPENILKRKKGKKLS